MNTSSRDFPNNKALCFLNGYDFGGLQCWLVGQIEGQEAAKGNVLPFVDLVIAAAIEQGYAVLTSNLRHFQKIPGLTVIPFGNDPGQVPSIPAPFGDNR